MSAYIYTQEELGSNLKEDKKDVITISKNDGKELPPFMAAYIYTQSGGKPKDTKDSIVIDKSAGGQLPPFLAAYIYTQSEIPVDILEGIKATYIYTL